MNLIHLDEQYSSDGRRDRFNIYLILSSVFHIIAAAVFVLYIGMHRITGYNSAEQTEEFEVSPDEYYDFTISNFKMLRNGESSVYETAAEDGSQIQSSSAAGTGSMNVLTYNDAVKQLIERKKEYPPNARKRKIEGEISVSFTINRKGVINSLEIKRSSGYDILDQAALSTVKDASPFPEFDSSIKEDEIELNVVLVYKL